MMLTVVSGSDEMSIRLYGSIPPRLLTASPLPAEVPHADFAHSAVDVPVSGSDVMSIRSYGNILPGLSEPGKGDPVKLVGWKKESVNGTMGVIETGEATGGHLEVRLDITQSRRKMTDS